ncbi:MAG: ATPase, T2SS/T4P/T4SS family, partial [Marinirhabdus sp.]
MKKIIKTGGGPAPIGPYNQAVLKGGMLFTSGQIAINPKTGKLEIGDLERETTLVMENLKAVLAKAEMTFANALRAFLRQDPDIVMVGEIRDLETAEIAIKAAQT